ncbi:cardiolipin synthase [Alloscardovia criceti]|uniref:cardiolipin synthase n=1 Tax=Alloscardovia criceti TaxID=356828 RepID=UPI00036F031E|nr:cardiolipin synthase [Alloscardovia criceti]
MAHNIKTDSANSVIRMFFVAFAFIFQLAVIILFFLGFEQRIAWASSVLSAIAFFVILYIVGRDTNSAFKITWIIFIGVIPIVGLIVYFLFGTPTATRRSKDAFNKNHKELSQQLSKNPQLLAQLDATDKGIANQFRYLQNQENFPVYSNTDVQFFADATDGLTAQLEDLAQAQDFIFMDYHAIEDGASFHKIATILQERAHAGVEVRIVYDEVGSLGFINRKFVSKMNAMGIQCKVFNPLHPVLNIFMNNRDHRKITVIDGKVGFTGGYNLANEYFNLVNPFGHWKDTGVRLQGDAVQSLTASFLEMWHYADKDQEDFSAYLTIHEYTAQHTGFIAPYADTPTDNAFTSENVYLNAIKNAKESVYIATPYFIISDEMNRELSLAAQRGVDVHIITPGIPDKKLIYRVTRSYYGRLTSHGVHIHEYTPGFIHEKQVLIDDELAIVGTINFDYRSLYHHFENAVLFYGYDAIAQVKQDFQQTIAVSEDVSERYSDKASLTQFADIILRLLAPLF